jgi:gluconolactonase
VTLRAEIVAADLPFGEGPAWCPDDGTLVLTRIATGALRRLWPNIGKSEVIVTMPGGANAAQRADDGGFVFTNNGGIDFSPIWDAQRRAVVDAPPFQPARPGIGRVDPAGGCSYVTTEDIFAAPNDLVVGADGTLYFTDPPRLPDGLSVGGGPEHGRVWTMPPGDVPRVLAEDYVFCNGIALSPEGRLLVVEDKGLQWLDHDGSKDWLVETLPEGLAGDGFCFDDEGRIYLATPHGGFLSVLDAEGRELDRLETGEGSSPTNCCFGGEDGRTLFVVEIFPGRVHAVEHLPAPGVPQVPWPVSDVNAEEEEG